VTKKGDAAGAMQRTAMEMCVGAFFPVLGGSPLLGFLGMGSLLGRGMACRCAGLTRM
jgi:hypothetical protein